MGVPAAGADRRTLPLGMRILLGVGFVLALAATGLVVFADDVKLLRLAAVLALWVALIAAFAIARSRRDTRSAQRRQEEIRLSYEVELHREIAARLEYEAGLSRQLESAHSDQLESLRGEIDRLASALSRLLDGELLIERVTLSAESTRVRALSDVGLRAVGGAATAIDPAPSPGGEVVDEVDGVSAEQDEPSGDDPIVAPGTDGGAAPGSDPDDGEGADDVPGQAPGDDDATVDDGGLVDAPVIDAAVVDAGIVDAVEEAPGTVGTVGLPEQASLDSDELPSEPLPVIQRIDAPATGWTWSHRAASPVPVRVGAGSAAAVPVAALGLNPLPLRGSDGALLQAAEDAEAGETDAGTADVAAPVDADAASTVDADGARTVDPDAGPTDATALVPPVDAHLEPVADQPAVDVDADTDADADADADDEASVPIVDLLAAYGLDGGSRRRRRRK